MQKEKMIWKILLVLFIYLIPVGVAVLVCALNWNRWENWLMCLIAGAGAVLVSILARMFVIGLEQGLAK